MQEDDLVDDAENSGKGGCGLGGNLDVSVCRAEWYFHLGGYQACTSAALAMTPSLWRSQCLYVLHSILDQWHRKRNLKRAKGGAECKQLLLVSSLCGLCRNAMHLPPSY